MPSSKPQLPNNQLVRVVDHAASASAVLAVAATRQWSHCQIAQLPNPPASDYTQIDLTLSIATGNLPAEIGPVQVGTGYAGLTPLQRGAFLQWVDDLSAPAPVAFQQLYLAHLEVNLLEGGARARTSQQELQELATIPAWQDNEGIARTAWLAYWLAQDGAGLANWPNLAGLPTPLIGKFLGNQASLGSPLQPEQWAVLIVAWQLAAGLVQNGLAIRLRSLTTNLGQDPLAVALYNLGEQAHRPQPWRTFHRDLRLAWPQPDLRPTLTPLLNEALQADLGNAATGVEETPIHQDVVPPRLELNWHLILEFGHSRSDIFHFALTLAQRHPGFSQLLDEDRKVVYRVLFKKQEMRQFWRLWDYVQGWAATRVYVNGEELDKWKIYPYSQFMR